jgi:hypothetical protein
MYDRENKIKTDEHDVEIEINLSGLTNDTELEVDYIAAAPADMMTNFSGSGLPYGSIEQAYYNTPNKGRVKSVNGIVVLKLQKPNSYFKDFNTLQYPHVLLFHNKKLITDVLIETEKINNRSLQYNNNIIGKRSPTIANQENILKSKEYRAHFYV